MRRTSMRATCSAGGFLGTAEDLVRFGSAHLSPGFFKPATLELLFKGQSVIPPGNQTAVGILWRIGKDSTGDAFCTMPEQARVVGRCC